MRTEERCGKNLPYFFYSPFYKVGIIFFLLCTYLYSQLSRLGTVQKCTYIRAYPRDIENSTSNNLRTVKHVLSRPQCVAGVKHGVTRALRMARQPRGVTQRAQNVRRDVPEVARRKRHNKRSLNKPESQN